MNDKIIKIIDYILNILISDNELLKSIQYGDIADCKPKTRLLIKKSHFFDDGILYTQNSIPKLPLSKIDGTDLPFLFGESSVERVGNLIVVNADLVASTFFLLSRYEEIVNVNSRDRLGRFLAKDSIIFKAGYGERPLIDEWSLFLHQTFKSNNIKILNYNHGFSNIYLTHDIDVPFRVFNLFSLLKEYIKKFLKYKNAIRNPLSLYIDDGANDPNNTFIKIINYDNQLKINNNNVISIYFIISMGSFFTLKYCNIFSKKYIKLIKNLIKSNSIFGIHISSEAGKNPKIIHFEIKRINKLFSLINYKGNTNNKLFSRNHCLMWNKPEDIDYIEKAGITDDFTLGYPDNIGFRCGTSRPFKFINPKTLRITNVTIHPLEIMECTLDRENYMNLSFDSAYMRCVSIIDEVHKYHGELNILWHNTSFNNDSYQEKLYIRLLEYIEKKEKIIDKSLSYNN